MAAFERHIKGCDGQRCAVTCCVDQHQSRRRHSGTGTQSPSGRGREAPWPERAGSRGSFWVAPCAPFLPSRPPDPCSSPQPPVRLHLPHLFTLLRLSPPDPEAPAARDAAPGRPVRGDGRGGGLLPPGRASPRPEEAAEAAARPGAAYRPARAGGISAEGRARHGAGSSFPPRAPDASALRDAISGFRSAHLTSPPFPSCPAPRSGPDYISQQPSRAAPDSRRGAAPRGTPGAVGGAGVATTGGAVGGAARRAEAGGVRGVLPAARAVLVDRRSVGGWVEVCEGSTE